MDSVVVVILLAGGFILGLLLAAWILETKIVEAQRKIAEAARKISDR